MFSGSSSCPQAFSSHNTGIHSAAAAARPKMTPKHTPARGRVSLSGLQTGPRGPRYFASHICCDLTCSFSANSKLRRATRRAASLALVGVQHSSHGGFGDQGCVRSERKRKLLRAWRAPKTQHLQQVDSFKV